MPCRTEKWTNRWCSRSARVPNGLPDECKEAILIGVVEGIQKIVASM